MPKDQTRIYIFKDTDEKIEELATLLKIDKVHIVEIAMNYYYRKFNLKAEAP